jgi:hypothetical protein
LPTRTRISVGDNVGAVLFIPDGAVVDIVSFLSIAEGDLVVSVSLAGLGAGALVPSVWLPPIPVGATVVSFPPPIGASELVGEIVSCNTGDSVPIPGADVGTLPAGIGACVEPPDTDGLIEKVGSDELRGTLDGPNDSIDTGEAVSLPCPGVGAEEAVWLLPPEGACDVTFIPIVGTATGTLDAIPIDGTLEAVPFPPPEGICDVIPVDGPNDGTTEDNAAGPNDGTKEDNAAGTNDGTKEDNAAGATVIFWATGAGATVKFWANGAATGAVATGAATTGAVATGAATIGAATTGAATGAVATGAIVGAPGIAVTGGTVGVPEDPGVTVGELDVPIGAIVDEGTADIGAGVGEPGVGVGIVVGTDVGATTPDGAAVSEVIGETVGKPLGAAVGPAKPKYKYKNKADFLVPVCPPLKLHGTKKLTRGQECKNLTDRVN